MAVTLTFTETARKRTVAKITLLDMAGAENVDVIQRSYFESVGCTKYKENPTIVGVSWPTLPNTKTRLINYTRAGDLNTLFHSLVDDTFKPLEAEMNTYRQNGAMSESVVVPNVTSWAALFQMSDSSTHADLGQVFECPPSAPPLVTARLSWCALNDVYESLDRLEQSFTSSEFGIKVAKDVELWKLRTSDETPILSTDSRYPKLLAAAAELMADPNKIRLIEGRINSMLGTTPPPSTASALADLGKMLKITVADAGPGLEFKRAAIPRSNNTDFCLVLAALDIKTISFSPEQRMKYIRRFVRMMALLFFCVMPDVPADELEDRVNNMTSKVNPPKGDAEKKAPIRNFIRIFKGQWELRGANKQVVNVDAEPLLSPECIARLASSVLESSWTKPGSKDVPAPAWPEIADGEILLLSRYIENGMRGRVRALADQTQVELDDLSAQVVVLQNRLRADLSRCPIEIGNKVGQYQWVRDILDPASDIAKLRTAQEHQVAAHASSMSAMQRAHCPLRYQGNFISNSISEIGTFAKSLTAQDTADSAPVPPKWIKDALRMDPGADMKFVQFVAVRADFGWTNDPVGVKGLMQSIRFASDINPLEAASSAALVPVVPVVHAPAIDRNTGKTSSTSTRSDQSNTHSSEQSPGAR